MEEVKLEVQNLGKKYYNRWIFKDFSYAFHPDIIYGISGNNGSGKSTLLKVLSQYLSPSEGIISVFFGGKKVDALAYAQNTSFVGPYVDIIDELTLIEMLEFHFKFKELDSFNSLKQLMEKIGLEDKEDTPIHEFSSGMQQRLKLGLGLYSKNKVILLDEPTSFLDAQGKNWFQTAFSDLKDTLCIIASNDPADLDLCDEIIDVNHLQKN